MVILIIIILCVLIGGFLFYASYSIRSNIYVKAYCKKKTDEKIIALTFDDGPHPIHTMEVLDILKKYDAKATFFCIAEKAEKFPEIIKRIHQEGHIIGNHSWKHTSYFPLLSKTKMEEEVHKTDKLLENITGERIRFFRPPFGVTNPTIASVVRQTHHKVIGWSIRSLDTRNEPLKKTFLRIITPLSPGDVILLHDRMPHSRELLTLLLEHLKNQQYKIVPIDKLFDI